MSLHLDKLLEAYRNDRGVSWAELGNKGPATHSPQQTLVRVGAAAVEVLPIEDFAFFRFYRLRR